MARLMMERQWGRCDDLGLSKSDLDSVVDSLSTATQVCLGGLRVSIDVLLSFLVFKIALLMQSSL